MSPISADNAKLLKTVLLLLYKSAKWGRDGGSKDETGRGGEEEEEGETKRMGKRRRKKFFSELLMVAVRFLEKNLSFKCSILGLFLFTFRSFKVKN